MFSGGPDPAALPHCPKDIYGGVTVVTQERPLKPKIYGDHLIFVPRLLDFLRAFVKQNKVFGSHNLRIPPTPARSCLNVVTPPSCPLHDL